MTRTEAARRTLLALHFFRESRQGEEPEATGYKGFYYHFLDMKSGKRVWNCELSLVDTALLMAGVCVAGTFFDKRDEQEIRDLSRELFDRVDWRWAQNGRETLSQGWRPDCGFLHYGWEGYNEATILYVLGAGSTTHPLTDKSFSGWTSTYQWEHLLGQDVLYSGPLFTHLFSHTWIDFRGIRDAFMRQTGSDYFENTKATIRIHREHAARNPRAYSGYDRDFWGVTAGDGPGDQDMREDGRDRRYFGYMSRGVPYGPDDGTISPWAMLACLSFDREAALSGTRHLIKRYPQVISGDRFSSGFNPTLVVDGVGWLSKGWYGLDQGLLVMAIENARSGFVWDMMRDCAPIVTGLKRSGFAGGWLAS
ncbi:glucoamylase family protein [Mesorhizobium sp. INR15]|uniref:glucoamylase family protein n=1 Tax=Mesorhizobium sp. INR15 TaxID=2654248 RepID=UPI0027E4479B|nr:glucoamylase family protein [Mesorhizobium sp. INR15]